MAEDDLRGFGDAGLFGSEVGELGVVKIQATETREEGGAGGTEDANLCAAVGDVGDGDKMGRGKTRINADFF